MSSFGQVIADARKEAGLSQKDLAARITKEDGTPISPQYLNDIEHDRRNPPSEHIMRQFADKLDLSLDYLFYLAGQLPGDVPSGRKPEEIAEAFKAFRRVLKRGKE